ncbi:MAG TPA: hypothetical protein ENJ82_02815 [Bacteroidetes bacterium]|nr:hypothetical protein [Bacteroidota bacterium]
MTASSHIRKSFLPSLFVVLFILGMTTELQAQRRYRVGYKDAGFSGIIEGAALFPSNTYNLAFNLDVILGMQVNANIFVGGGIGLDAYESDLFSTVFVDARYFFIADQFTPFFFLDAGYALPIDINPNISGGPMVNPGVGIKYFFTKTVGLNLSVAYRFQSMPINTDNPDGSVALKTNWIQSPNLRLGIQF